MRTINSSCRESQPFPTYQVAELVRRIEENLGDGTTGYRLFQSYAAKKQGKELPDFRFATLTPIAFDNFEPKWFEDWFSLYFSSVFLSSVNASALFRDMCKSFVEKTKRGVPPAQLWCRFKDNISSLSLQANKSGGINGDIRPDFASNTDPEYMCHELNRQFALYASVLGDSSRFAAKGGKARWKAAKGSEVHCMDPAFSIGSRGDFISPKIPEEEVMNFVGACERYLNENHSMVALEFFVCTDTKNQLELFTDLELPLGIYSYQVSGCISLDAKAFLKSGRPSYRGFIPAFSHLGKAKYDPNFSLSFQCEGNESRCLVGVDDYVGEISKELVDDYVRACTIQEIFEGNCRVANESITV